ncbi:MAG: hypothetical protein QMD22_11540 [archaeon]|nr:hypothetical protein [archaeon]
MGEERSKPEGVVPELSKRVDDLRAEMNARFSDIYSRLNHLETEINELRGDLKKNFRWMVGLIVATWALIISMWVTVIMAIVK